MKMGMTMICWNLQNRQFANTESVRPSKVSGAGLSAPHTSLKIKHPNGSSRRQTLIGVIDHITYAALSNPRSSAAVRLRWRFWGVGYFEKANHKISKLIAIRQSLASFW
jgi:hypothetical protein